MTIHTQLSLILEFKNFKNKQFKKKGLKFNILVNESCSDQYHFEVIQCILSQFCSHIFYLQIKRHAQHTNMLQKIHKQ